MSRLQDGLVLLARGRPNAHAPTSLNVWLVELSKFGAFPIPQRVTGAAILEEKRARLFYFPHMLYYEMAVHAVVAWAKDPLLHVVSAHYRQEATGHLIVTGSAKHIPVIPPNGQTLMRMRALMREGSSIICLADGTRGAELIDRPMRLAAKSNVPVIFVSCDLEADGVFAIKFHEAPRPIPRTDEDIAVNMQALLEQQQADLARYACVV